MTSNSFTYILYNGTPIYLIYLYEGLFDLVMYLYLFIIISNGFEALLARHSLLLIILHVFTSVCQQRFTNGISSNFAVVSLSIKTALAKMYPT